MDLTLDMLAEARLAGYQTARSTLNYATLFLGCRLVRERVTQVASEKAVVKGIRIDPPREILANKLCALLSRSEIRDLVDVRALEMAGYRVEGASSIIEGRRIDSSATGWVLSQIEIGDDLTPPGGGSIEDLRLYLADLITRLARLAFPR